MSCRANHAGLDPSCTCEPTSGPGVDGPRHVCPRCGRGTVYSVCPRPGCLAEDPMPATDGVLARLQSAGTPYSGVTADGRNCHPGDEDLYRYDMSDAEWYGEPGDGAW